MLIAIQITLIGMGLVFLSILLLWLLMAVLVRTAADKQPDALAVQSDRDLRRKAAAAAVAMALAEPREELPHEFPLPPTAIVSAWQVVMRSKIINKRINTR